MGKKLLLILVLSVLLVGSIAVSRKKRSSNQAKLQSRDDAEDSSTTTTLSLFSCSGPSEESDWTYYPDWSTIACNTSTYVGPFGEYGYIYTTLSTTTSHNGVIISFSLAFIDSWDGELFSVYADDDIVFAMLYSDNETSSDTCQNYWDDNYIDLTFGFNHSSATLVLNFSSTLDQSSDDEAWGICDLNITTVNSYVDSTGYVLDVTTTGNISELTFNCESPESDDTWTYVPSYGTFYCNDNYYLGGFAVGDSISAILYVPDDHQNIILSFKLALIDSWDAETFNVTADGIVVYTITHTDIEGESNTCQSGWYDNYTDVQIGFSHNGQYLTMTFVSDLNQASNDEAWGICNLAIIATSGNVDSDGDYIGTGTGDSAPGSFFNCSSPALDEGWSYSPYYETITCDGYTFVGNYGWDGEISAVLTVSDDHNGVIVTFKLALLDSWENETFTVTADGTEVYTLTWDYYDSTENTCAADYDDNYEDITFGFNHTADTLTLVFTSNLDQSSADESWGICDLTISISEDYVDSDGTTIDSDDSEDSDD